LAPRAVSASQDRASELGAAGPRGPRPAGWPSIIDALDDPQLFAPAFRPAASWAAWRTVLTALFALAPTAEDLARYTTHTGRVTWPSTPVREAWLVVGRRGGKSRIAALIAVYLACFRDYSRVLARGERGVVMCIAADRRQARVVLRYIVGLLEAVPMLSALIDRRTAEAVHLSNRITLEVHTASFRSVRGYTVVGAVLDEVAYWPSEDSANPDTEIVNALRPAMATVPEPLLLGISSPYARRGVLWEAFKQHYSQDHPVLVWKAPTTAMNPTIAEAFVAGELDQDEAAARGEYLAEFRTDIETFVSREVVETCVIWGRRELPPRREVSHVAFTDPAGGSGADAFTLAIAHGEVRDGRRIAVVDAIRERRPPFSPEQTVAEFAALLRTYGLREVVGDRFGGEFPREMFRAHGVTYVVADQVKRDLYVNALPHLNAGTVELLDHPRLVAQLSGLERHTHRGGRDTIDHAPQGHDDIANAVCGVVADLLVLAPGAEGGPVAMRGESLDFAGWGRRVDAYNTGAVHWGPLDADDQRRRRRAAP
jgi:hypothetical protein